VTTAAAAAPSQSARAGAPARKQAAPARQRLSTAVLVIGTALSLASLAGPDWVLRAGVVVALASAAASCALAWHELYLTKRGHARELLTVGREHTEDLRSERQHNADLLATVSGRAERWRREVDRQQTQIAGLRVDVSALRSDLGSVRRQLVRANGTITELRETVRERDVELALAEAKVTSSDAEVRALPRRIRLERTEAAGATGAQGHTVIDLPVEEPALPNFEADRRRA
jgi:hypothetical protein